MIGDSYIQALELPIAQKVQVVLEQLAAQALPQLNVTTSAFGRSNTAQANQIAIYDKYVRPLAPKVLVAFFSPNDFGGNSALTVALRQGWDPETPPFAFPQRLDDGRVVLQPPVPQMHGRPTGRFRLLPFTRGYDVKSASALCRANHWLGRRSYFARWLEDKSGQRVRRHCRGQATAYWREQLRQRPAYRALIADDALLAQEQVEFTAFAFAGLAERAARDGASLLVLADFGVAGWQRRNLDRIANELGLAVLSLRDYAVDRGLRTAALRWDHDQHWNALGHRQAAQALLEWVKENEGVCRQPA